MKTNIFYKVAAVTNSSPKLGEVPQAEEYVRTSATSALTDSLGASATPPNLGGESKEGSVKTHNLTAHIAQRKELRTNGTAAEATLWKMLKARQVMGKKFRRQFSIESYVLDFYCPEVRLAVELDGQPHYTIEGDMHDTDRDEYLLSIHGIRTLRFENCDVFRNPEGVLAEIKEALAASDRPLSPSDSSPNLVEQSDTPSAEVTNCPPKLGGRAKRRGSVMAAAFTFALSAFTFLASCTQDDIAPAYNNSPLTITATIPGDVWAVATRAEGEGTVTYSDWTLHYTDYRGTATTGTLTATSSQEGTYTLTTDNGLVWAKVNTTKPMHLTARCDNGTPSDDDATDDYTLHTSVPSATAGEELAFPDMKHTLAKFTVNFMFSYNMEQNAPTADDFAVTIDAKKAADSYDPMTHGGTWPIGDGDVESGQIFSQQSAATYTYTASKLLPQQTMGETMIVKYDNGTDDIFEDDISWTIDLSKVAASHVQVGQMANELIAGQHLTLNLKAGLTAINTPSDIQIEAFTAADADDYNPDLGGVAKTYEYDADTETYIVYDERCIETALANRAVNHPNAAVVSKAPTLAVVNGAETNLATIQAAIAGKTTIYVLGTTLAEYSGTAKTVVGEAICTSNAANSTISLVMPEVTTIGDYAFRYCYALKTITLSSSIENTGLNAFSSTSAEISYNGMSLYIASGELRIDNAGDDYNPYLPVIIANGSLCVKVDGTCEGRPHGNAQHIEKMKRIIQSAIAKGMTGVYVTGTYLTEIDSSNPDYLLDGPQTVLGMAISQLNVADGTINVFLPEVETIPDGAFNRCPAIKNITYGQ